jgi:hypothetical protein
MAIERSKTAPFPVVRAQVWLRPSNAFAASALGGGWNRAEGPKARVPSRGTWGRQCGEAAPPISSKTSARRRSRGVGPPPRITSPAGYAEPLRGLRAVGIDVDFGREAHMRTIILRYDPNGDEPDPITEERGVPS